MGAPIPTLGFTSRTAAIAHLRGLGDSTKTIAGKIGISPKKVQTIESSARNYRTARQAGSHSQQIVISLNTIAALVPAAEQRGISINKLVRTIMSVVARENLVDAVLDDRHD